MEFLETNWLSLVIVLIILVAVAYCVYVFIKRPTSEQIKSIKEWLLWAVTEAEKNLGSGTGQLKLRYVYNMFIERFRGLSSVITFTMFSALVDEALEKMKEMLTSNKAMQTYVESNAAPTPVVVTGVCQR